MASAVDAAPQTCFEACAVAAVARGDAPCIQAAIWAHGDVCSAFTVGAGDVSSVFDMASVTKTVTALAFACCVERGLVSFDSPLSSVLAEFSGAREIRPYENPLDWLGPPIVVDGAPLGETVDAGAVTFRQVLSHSGGLPAWRPLFRQPTAAAARAMVLATPFAYVPGTRVVYSDLGLILVGFAIERLTGSALGPALAALVLSRVPMPSTGFISLPCDAEPTCAPPIAAPGSLAARAVATEQCAWRARRVCGEVHDENAWRLGGVSGHAGLFSNATDMAALGAALLRHDEGALLRADTLAQMTEVAAEFGMVRRGLGFHLWGPDPSMSAAPLSSRAFGHTGFTGTSLWVDPARDAVIVLLTNEVFNGRVARVIAPLRLELMRQAVALLDCVQS